MGSNTISVFEHETLQVSHAKGEFNQHHFNMLVKFNDLHGGKYFTVGYNKIKFRSYVGVLQVGNKIIEILPKADHSPSHNEQLVTKWQAALLTMLQKAGNIRLNQAENASQNISRHHLMEIYLYTFLNELEHLAHLGLVKKYRRNISNEKVLKGRLLIHKHIQHNLIHKERFYTEHAVYDRNNIYNRILKRALQIIKTISDNSVLQLKVAQNLHYFEEIDSWSGLISEIDNLKFDRKTDSYRYAISLAKMIIQNYCPDFSSGHHHVLAILFDMNKLFENYIYSSLKKYEQHFEQQKLTIIRQNSKTFWEHKTIRPDIVVQYTDQNDEMQSFIIDTKWKVISEDAPSAEDLKQMYVYNFQFKANRSILLYPKTNQINKGTRNYEATDWIKEMTHGCELFFADLFDENEKLSEFFAQKFLEKNIL